MTARRCVASIPLAIGEGFSYPVTPSSTGCAPPRGEPVDQVAIAVRLVSGRLVIGLHADRDAAFGLFRPGPGGAASRACVLEQRIAALDELGKRLDGGGDAGTGGELVASSQGDIEAGHGLSPGPHASSDRSFRPSMCRGRFRRGDSTFLRCPAGLGRNFAPALEGARFRFRFELLHPVGDIAGKGRTGKRPCGASSNPAGCRRFLRGILR